MKRIPFLPLAAFAALLGGCTTTYVSPVEVTRFTGTRPDVLGQGAIAIRAAPGEEADSLAFSAYASAVAEELRQAGYTVVGGDAPQIAEVSVSRFVEQGVRDRSPVSVGGGGSVGSYGSGVGLGIGIDLSGRPKDRVDTQLRVMILPAGGGQALWEGRSHFTASVGSDYSDERAAAVRLADALFTGFPGRSGETIEVE